MRCWQCHTRLTGREDECPECGAPVEEGRDKKKDKWGGSRAVQVCPECGADVDSDADYCEECGAMMVDGAYPDDSEW